MKRLKEHILSNKSVNNHNFVSRERLVHLLAVRAQKKMELHARIYKGDQALDRFENDVFENVPPQT